jgi:hypothetical protein
MDPHLDSKTDMSNNPPPPKWEHKESLIPYNEANGSKFNSNKFTNMCPSWYKNTYVQVTLNITDIFLCQLKMKTSERTNNGSLC